MFSHASLSLSLSLSQEMSVKYWPGEVGEASLFGSFQLELSEDEKDKGDYVTRKFKLSHVDAVSRCVCHCLVQVVVVKGRQTCL